MIKVLIVDDEKIIRIGLKMMIPWEQHGFELIGAAEDGVAAMALVEQYKPDIVITDLKMPRVNGLELIQKLKDMPVFNGKIIAISNYGEYDLVREAMKLGAIDYLLKVTLKPENLLDILNNASSQLSTEKQKKEMERKKEVSMKRQA
ncbi:response regulator [Paenibacillus frigoriresistens]|uniref:response regulator n=1 Tax=Paenibacillus alginolyticus TaxID=59839 RepID=UPI001565969B|nr:response regulator [Paenibacillus frigoriresistens]NRF92439.1 response regulator [Paenibacillus frigoriresistens]